MLLVDECLMVPGTRAVCVRVHEHADAASEQAVSAYADLVRLTGHDPVSEILVKLRSSSRH